MSDSSDSSSSDEEQTELSSNFHELRGKLYEIDQELKKSIESLQRFQKNFTTLEEALSSSKQIPTSLLHHLEIWKKENRLNTNGSKVFLNKEEAIHYNLQEGWNSVYEVIKSLNK